MLTLTCSWLKDSPSTQSLPSKIVLCYDKAAPFNSKQIALLETFASQALIAMYNTRLFEEVRARTAEVNKR
ncbi:GAF domain-containing protein [uncultured Ruegeria sp.]|uniref:GAF domain-containing protein n=1 Tax=uncultured Ruegeria sp. TaxID=259304 RepID=UPI002610FD76|nr:GAF domain-containing protein [uncultured Ruegeria sp.]